MVGKIAHRANRTNFTSEPRKSVHTPPKHEPEPLVFSRGVIPSVWEDGCVRVGGNSLSFIFSNWVNVSGKTSLLIFYWCFGNHEKTRVNRFHCVGRRRQENLIC